MLERNVPDGERLKFSISCLDAAQVFVVQLGEADCELAASGAGSGNDNKLSLGLDILVSSVTRFAYYSLNVIGVSGN